MQCSGMWCIYKTRIIEDGWPTPLGRRVFAFVNHGVHRALYPKQNKISALPCFCGTYYIRQSRSLPSWQQARGGVALGLSKQVLQ